MDCVLDNPKWASYFSWEQFRGRRDNEAKVQRKQQLTAILIDDVQILINVIFLFSKDLI